MAALKELIWFLSWLPSAILMLVFGFIPVVIDPVFVCILISGSCYFGYAIYSDGMTWIESKENEKSLDGTEEEEGQAVEVQD